MRSIFTPQADKFLIPFWFDYDTRAKADMMLQNIKRIQKNGYHVVVITCDNHPDNRKLGRVTSLEQLSLAEFSGEYV